MKLWSITVLRLPSKRRSEESHIEVKLVADEFELCFAACLIPKELAENENEQGLIAKGVWRVPMTEAQMLRSKPAEHKF